MSGEDKAIFNANILQQLQANDLKIVRALAEGDTAKVQTHVANQAALRGQLIP